MLPFALSFFWLHAASQIKILKGTIKDAYSDEPVPFASMELKNAKAGRLSDSAGSFVFRFDGWPKDTLVVSYVGYQDYKLAIDSSFVSHAGNKGMININIKLERGKYQNEIVVRKKVDFGLLMWKRIVRRKKFNDRYRFNNFSYELYNKLELDLDHVNKEKMKEKKLLRPLSFVLDNIDTSEGSPFLPVYLTETLSDYYYQKKPVRRREVIKGSKTIGVDNPSLSQLLGGMEQNVDFYSNFIAVFDKKFVSPISDHGDDYYRYKVVDTQFVNSKKFFHLIFTPKRKGQSTFEGDCWVHDTTFAIQKMNLRLSEDANINFVKQLSLIQEFSLLNDSTWFLDRDKFVVYATLIGKNKGAFIGRKTTTYKNIVTNDSGITKELDKNKNIEETILEPGSRNRPDSFWANHRHETLSKNEKAVYVMVDTLLKMPIFHKYVNYVNFIATGYLDVYKKYQIGPWFSWVYSNVLEGLRLRFDLGTNRYFNKKLILHGYAAYGFGNQQWHWEGDALYVIRKNPRLTLYGMYKQDLDFGQQYYDEISSDNIFALAFRKANIPIKFIHIEQKKLELFKEWHSGFSVTLTGDNKAYDPAMNLPPKRNYPSTTGQALNSFEVSVKLRFAYLEKFFENNFYRISLGSDYPIIDFKYTRGISGALNSSYNYNKISASVSDYKKIPPLGTLYYNVFGGKTFQTLPFPFLDIAPGNEIYYYNPYAFSLMNKYQYLNDRYAGINIEHNIGNGLFRFIPFTRKLKFRQFWTAKALWGSLSNANKLYNTSPDYTFQTLNGKTYLELGTGVDNIFKFLRLDLVWRLAPTPEPPGSASGFGIFGSFRIDF
ncbi:MAG: carboxypeptidase-like regulatory domain-containing protein [Bacteroidetes bacterium]|nr:carboxypeptidase-like regulatory domain-containing protein [Bacteroidota bacterium]MBS1973634.1 carboxypeptidase-like regulatory domain-containing protein [Bacteroidota bacterium]